MAAEQFRTYRQRLAALVAVPAALLLTLTACSSTETGQVPAAPASADSSASSPAAGSEVPDLPDSHQAVQAALTELLAANPAPSREDIRGAWASAGFSPEAVEVSQDGTPTGLAVDSIVSAAPDGAQCLVGEIRSGKLAVTTVPVLANGQCFLGDDR